MAASDDREARKPPNARPGGTSDGSIPVRHRRRSLRVVFAADIAGFSGRMSLNETNTVNALSEIRIIGRRALEKHNGWLFGMPGDGLFATFESAVNAVQCALELQQNLHERQDLREMPLRIGIHLGEVIIDDEGIPYGETLNIAARLEALADHGGILVSGTVMDAVSSRISARFEARGVPVLKNIPRRIPTFAVKPPPARSPADETRIGLSSLDKTTRLDRSDIEQLLSQRAAANAAEPPAQAGSNLTAQPLNQTAPPKNLDSTKPILPGASPSTNHPSSDPATNAESQPKTLAERITGISPRSAPEPPGATASEPPFKPNIQPSPAPPLEKTLPEELPPEAQPEPEPIPGPTLAIATSAPSQDFIDEITKALAVHLGPFAKLIVEREMKSGPNVFELISMLEEHVPNDDERLVFRVRASQINAAAKEADRNS